MNKKLNELIYEEDLTYETLKSNGYLISDLLELAAEAKIVNNKELANRCYELIYQFNENNMLACYNLFVKKISERDFLGAKDYLIKLYEEGSYSNDTYTYLMLLNNLVELPESIKNELSKLKFTDIAISRSDSRFVKYELTNDIRRAIYERNYRKCLSLSKSLYLFEKTLTSQEYVISVLVSEVIKREKELNDFVIDAIDNGNFADIYEIFKSWENNLNEKEKEYYYLLYIISTLLSGGMLPKKYKSGSSYVACINNNDFKGAKNYTNDPLIQKLLDIIINEDCISRENNFRCAINENAYLVIENIYNAFINGDSESIKNTLVEYLHTINKEEFSEYLKIIVDMTLENQNIDFIIENIEAINYPVIKINTKFLKNHFFANIKRKEYKIAKYVLDALKALESVYQNNVNVEYLEYVYNSVMQKEYGIDYKDSLHDKKIIEEAENVYKSFFQTRDIKVIKNLSESDVLKIESYYQRQDYRMKNVRDKFKVDYCVVKVGDTYTMYVRKYVVCSNFDKEHFIKKANRRIESSNYERALSTYFQALVLSEHFDADIIERIADVFELLNKPNMVSKYREISANIAGIDFGVSYDEEVEKEYNLDNYYYDIPNIDDIIDAIIHGEVIENVIKYFKVSEEDIPYIYTIIAREYYKLNQMNLGDKYLQKVLNKRINDKELSRFINEVNSSKNFYQYRKESNFINHIKELIK